MQLFLVKRHPTQTGLCIQIAKLHDPPGVNSKVPSKQPPSLASRIVKIDRGDRYMVLHSNAPSLRMRTFVSYGGWFPLLKLHTYASGEDLVEMECSHGISCLQGSVDTRLKGGGGPANTKCAEGGGGYMGGGALMVLYSTYPH